MASPFTPPTLPGGGSGAPTTADYLVGTTNADLSAEIVAGTAPGGELGGTWASPTVDAIHSGSPHAGYLHVVHRSGLYYGLPYVSGSAALTLVQSELLAQPLWFPVAATIDRLGVITIATGSATVRLGLYADAGTGIPGALLVDGGTVDGSTTSAKEVTVSQAVGPGLVWFAWAAQGAAAVVRGASLLSRLGVAATSLNSVTSPSNGSVRRVTVDCTGALPGTFGAGSPATADSDRTAFLGYRIA
jgi:hypothetical protein